MHGCWGREPKVLASVGGAEGEEDEGGKGRESGKHEQQHSEYPVEKRRSRVMILRVRGSDLCGDGRQRVEYVNGYGNGRLWILFEIE